jgi:hypothetical protein
VVTIALCFIVLPFTPRLAASRSVLCVLAIAVGFGVVCLLLYVWLIVAMVRRLVESLKGQPLKRAAHPLFSDGRVAPLAPRNGALQIEVRVALIA